MTQDENDGDGLWVLGYGSLIYKPPPHFTHRIPATIFGFMRRFWQSSVDHRGVPEYPGRVTTLIPYEEIVANPRFQEELRVYYQDHEGISDPADLTTVGVVYYIPPEFAQEVREYLDVREQNGYTLHEVEVHLDVPKGEEEQYGEALSSLARDPVSGKHILKTTVYIGTTLNKAFVGPETIADTAHVICTARGPSGENYEYLEKLYYALKGMQLQGALQREDHYLERLFNEVNRQRSV
ncbi:gamma-glutamylcyclotransferase KNAG_0G01780 [Huiozyma naganishii CBS 8797]|uniref:glutathione-specific gamma-glutamylcyclotransferase n=1 Tax=Huiozyma naganishii (strain ATCC MYA-139 / BCRC 22969 / CBS 8797 / KCTC 17520 / NBRC 10181 / NCYC 3082 / Yp74L-3) TaxID=1071383 RepID=J7S914_HUIN7|nr:hypothetical protein KNAG_0G01780 [Kazachstania naganishii CBS 8797]CCK71236.1 hypothetical protein KNAG_0G01780 [Kazachstania naganishii CBS 8797]